MNKWPAIFINNAQIAIFLIVILSISGCANVGYYWQSVTGHLQVMRVARPVQDWLDDSKTPEAVRKRLELAQQLRTFASQELGLPDNASYRRYADLQRRSVVYNVVAAPEFSLQLKTWCFPVAGCVAYRGYYNEADAKAYAGEIKPEGLETSVYGVPAYSTLGYLNWAGGDPLLSTFIHYPQGELARMLFHELAHQVLYVNDDTMFNESFATAVERIGGRLWMQRHGSLAAQLEYAQFDARRQAFRTLTLRTRARLTEIYKTNVPINDVNNAQVAIKSIATLKLSAMQDLRTEYAQLKINWNGYSAYDPWIANANNASFGALAAYDELVPQFEALHSHHAGDWQKFYDAVKALVPLQRDARRKALADQSGLLSTIPLSN